MCDCFRKLWPTKRYTETAADLSEIPLLIEEIQHLFDQFGAMSPTGIIKQLGFKLKYHRLNADKDGLDALLIPRHQCIEDGIQFSVIVDMGVGSLKAYIEKHFDNLKQGQLVLRDYRIAHEIGHTFFYHNWRENLKTVPTRARKVSADPTEEVWCDEFAIQLLQPSLEEAGLALLRLCADQTKRRLKI